MRADPSPRLARSGELSLALHLESGSPPLRVRAHVEPGEEDSGPWLRFKDLAPAEAERLDRLLTGLWVLRPATARSTRSWSARSSTRSQG